MMHRRSFSSCAAAPHGRSGDTSGLRPARCTLHSSPVVAMLTAASSNGVERTHHGWATHGQQPLRSAASTLSSQQQQHQPQGALDASIYQPKPLALASAPKWHPSLQQQWQQQEHLQLFQQNLQPLPGSHYKMEGPKGSQSSSSSLTQTPSSASSLALSSQDECSAGANVTVNFHLRYKTSWGQAVRLIGSHGKLGNWSLAKAAELCWRDGDVWVATVIVPASLGVLEYKYVVVDYDSKQAVAWQQGGNSVLAIKPDERIIEVHDNWGNTPGALVRTEDGESSTRELKLQAWAGEMVAYRQEARQARMELQQHTDETSQLRAENLRLRAELQQAQSARMQAEMQIMELQQDNMLLKSQVADLQIQMRTTLDEAVRLLQAQDGPGYYADEEEGEAVDETDSMHDEQAGTNRSTSFTDAAADVDTTTESTQPQRAAGVGLQSGVSQELNDPPALDVFHQEYEERAAGSPGSGTSGSSQRQQQQLLEASQTSAQHRPWGASLLGFAANNTSAGIPPRSAAAGRPSAPSSDGTSDASDEQWRVRTSFASSPGSPSERPTSSPVCTTSRVVPSRRSPWHQQQELQVESPQAASYWFGSAVGGSSHGGSASNRTDVAAAATVAAGGSVDTWNSAGIVRGGRPFSMYELRVSNSGITTRNFLTGASDGLLL